MTTTTTVRIIREVEIEVDVRYTKGVADTVWEPGREAEAEILDAYDEIGQSINLSDNEEDRVLQMVLENPPEFPQP
jgi:hypothetical protein